jgi:hypothetical protein
VRCTKVFEGCNEASPPGRLAPSPQDELRGESFLGAFQSAAVCNCRQLPFAWFELSCDCKTLTAASTLPYTGQIPDNLAHLNLKITFL